MTEVPVRPAATVMLVRDDPDLHVFMVRRNPKVVFGPGAFVFPGGAVDPADAHPGFEALVDGIDDARASALLGTPAGGLRYWVAAARESFEEADIVLGRAPESFRAVRAGLNAGSVDFHAALREHDVRLDLAGMHVFAHWLTPVGSPRRYDTWFFVAAAPSGQEGSHDDSETVHSEWVRPADMLERARRRELELIFPTLRSLQALARFDRTEALLDAVAAAQPVDGALRLVGDSSGERVHLPGDDEPLRSSWRPLTSRLDLDLAAEAEFFDEGVA